MGRTGKTERKTKETEISVVLDLDGKGQAEVETGMPFFNHMLEIFTRHGLFDVKIKAKGDLEVDYHHTVEDVGLVLGQAFKEALGDKHGFVASARQAARWTRRWPRSWLTSAAVLISPTMSKSARGVGDFDTDLPHEFYAAFTNQLGMNLHMDVIRGENPHHIIEACFKAFARAMDMATQLDTRIQEYCRPRGVFSAETVQYV